jgi:hypothetical protein
MPSRPTLSPNGLSFATRPRLPGSLVCANQPVFNWIEGPAPAGGGYGTSVLHSPILNLYPQSYCPIAPPRINFAFDQEATP